MNDIQVVDSSERNDEQLKGKSQNSRRILAQVLAGTASSLPLLGLGISMNAMTVVIAGISSGNDIIKATENEISWIGSMGFICQPVGSILSGAFMEPIGRKKAMILINSPSILAWIILWCARDLSMIFVANALFGFATGLMEAPTITYTGEICEPSFRGTLVSYTAIFTAFGFFSINFLGTIFEWRTAAAACITVPLLTILAISLIPESPIWLLSKGRDEDALKALCWLRGWVDPPQVEVEFQKLKIYNAANQRCHKCGPEINECPHRNEHWTRRIPNRLRQMTEKATLRPLILTALFFSLSTMTGFYSIRPNLVNVFRVFNVAIDAHWATVGVGALLVFGACLCCALVKLTGKRPLVLISMAGSCLSTLLLANYARVQIPRGTNTFEAVEIINENSSVTTLVLFAIQVLCNYTGIVPISWMILSEVFPFKTRGYASGLVAAFCYIMTFISAKTYINLENSLDIFGAFYVYSAITFVGFIYLYVALPETENRTHQEIETEFTRKGSSIQANDFLTKRIRLLCRKK